MKNTININNYESFWVDYLDGKLDSASEDLLFAFLEENHEVAGNLIDAENYKLPVLDITFPNKKAILAENQIDNLLIAKLENEISQENDNYITAKIKNNPRIEKSFQLYQKTILSPDKSIVFPNKEKLQKTVAIPFYKYATSIAAAISVVFIVGYLLMKNTESTKIGTDPQISKIEKSHLKDNTKNTVEEINEINVEKQENNFAYNSTVNATNVVEYNNITAEEISVPDRLPLKSLAQINNQQNLEENALSMEYRYDLPKEETAFTYTLEYKKSNKEENRFKSYISKIYNFGKEIDLKESVTKLKDFRDDLLFTSLEN